MPSHILITGGSGLLAINCAAILRDRYTVVLGLHKRSVALGGVDTRGIDLESPDSLASTITECRFDLVIHTAGFTSVEGCEANPDLANHINVTLAMNVARACADAGVPLAHISTDHLFSGDVKCVSEDWPVAAKNVYGRTKAEAEIKVLQENPGALVIRTNFYGWGSSYRRSFSDTVLDALRSGKEIALFKDAYYTPILIEALAEALIDLVKRGARGIFHVVGDERLSKYEFGLKIADEFCLDTSLIRPVLMAEQTSLVTRPFDMSLSNQKVCNLLGRSLGDVKEHIARLYQQEQSGFAQELRCL